MYMYSPAGQLSYLKVFSEFTGRRVRNLLIFDMFLGLVWFAIESSFIFIFQGFLVSITLLDKSTSILPDWYPYDFQSNIIILLVFGILRCLALMFKSYCLIYTSQVFLCEKRSELLEKALKSQVTISNNELVSTFSELVSQAGSHVVNATHLAHGLIISALFTFACLKVAFWESVAGIFFLGLALVPMKLAARKVTRYGDELIRNFNVSYSTLLNGLKNIFFLRLHEMTETEIYKGKKALSEYEQNYRSYAITSSLMIGLPQFVGIVVLVATAWLGLNTFKTSPPVLLSFFYLFIRLAQNASQTYSYSSYFRLTTAGFLKLKELMSSITPVHHDHFERTTIDQNALWVEMKNVTIGYNQAMPLLGPLNISLKINDLFLVKGPSGVGKTTLMKTILGDINPLSGEILFNSQPVSNVKNLADTIGYVGPEPFLIYGTVRENLLYGSNLNVSDSEIFDVLGMVGLHETVHALPNKIDEILKDETQLSSGQKQRLSFARALLRKPKFLVLDEATANIDIDTENKILKVLESLRNEMIIFVISHKDSFDRIASQRIDLG